MTNTAYDETFLASVASSSALLGTLFLSDPGSPEAGSVIAALSESSIGEWPFGSDEELSEVGELLDGADVDALKEDFQKLFVGPFALAAPPWGSVYLDYESVICGWSTTALKDWMSRNGIAIDLPSNEPEDHVGLMFMLLSWLAGNRPGLMSEYLEKHFCTWAPHFCELMESKALTPFYQGVAKLAHITLDELASELSLDMVEPKFYR